MRLSQVSRRNLEAARATTRVRTASHCLWELYNSWNGVVDAVPVAVGADWTIVSRWDRPECTPVLGPCILSKLLTAACKSLGVELSRSKLYHVSQSPPVRIKVTTENLRFLLERRPDQLWLYHPDLELGTTSEHGDDDDDAPVQINPLTILPPGPVECLRGPERADSSVSSRSSQELKRLRESLIYYWGHHCQLCGSTDAIEAAHIVPVEATREEQDASEIASLFQVSNGVLLCRACRTAFDQLYWHIEQVDSDAEDGVPSFVAHVSQALLLAPNPHGKRWYGGLVDGAARKNCSAIV